MTPQTIASRPAILPLPELDLSIPSSFTVEGQSRLSAPLAIALIEAGMISDSFFEPESKRLVDVFKPPHEKDLVERALTCWWHNTAEKLTLFHWDMSVQDFPERGRGDGMTPWICLTLAQDRMPHRLLAPHILKLERDVPGFGQTVLAVLEDAFRYLPESLTPQSIYGMAQMYYWMGEIDERLVIEENVGDGAYPSVEAFLADSNLFRAEDFFQNMPRWIANPKRQLGRLELLDQLNGAWNMDVFEACDAIWNLVHTPTFTLERRDVGVSNLDMDCVSGCVFLQWDENDACMRVVDDFFQYAYENGEDTEFISAVPVKAARKDIATYLAKLENMVDLAALVERLLLLISHDIDEEVRIRV